MHVFKTSLMLSLWTTSNLAGLSVMQLLHFPSLPSCNSPSLGPFKANPFHCSLMISPLLTVPKKNSTSHQIVMDLSFPVGCSVNDGIPKDTFLGEPFQLCLPGVEALATLIHCCGPNCLIFKKDPYHAYRQFLIDPHDYHYLGFL